MISEIKWTGEGECLNATFPPWRRPAWREGTSIMVGQSPPSLCLKPVKMHGVNKCLRGIQITEVTVRPHRFFRSTSKFQEKEMQGQNSGYWTETCTVEIESQDQRLSEQNRKWELLPSAQAWILCFAATQGMVKISCQGILKKSWSNGETRAETRTNKLRNSNQWWLSYLNFCKAYIWGNDINNDRKTCNEWERVYLSFFDNSSFLPFFCLIFMHGRSSQSMTCLPLCFP